MVVASVGWSTRSDADACGREAAARALELLPRRKHKLALVFGSSWLDQEQLLRGVRAVLDGVPLTGQSTAGEIIPDGPISHSCVVVLLASDALACSIGVSEGVATAPRLAGQQAASHALRDFPASPRAGFLLFGDGLIPKYADVVRGIQEVFGTSSLVVGAMAGDDLRFTQTYQYAQDRAVSRAVTGVLLGQPLKIGIGIEHGFAPISKPRRITRARANVLMELDRKPAASVYEEYFGADAAERLCVTGQTRQAIAYPLGLCNETTDRWLLRNVVSFGEGGSLVCNGDVQEGTWLQLMLGSRELVLNAARKAAQQAVQALNRVTCVLVFDSVIRRTLLGAAHAALEIARIREAVGSSTPMAGCYTYGEQVSFSASPAESCATQTGSVLVVALGD